MASHWETLKVDGHDMKAYVSLPDGPGPNPGVVVIQHASGVDDFIQNIADRLAREGYAGIAPDLYHREDPNSSDDAMTRLGRLRDANILDDVGAALAYFRGHSAVRGDRIGITGFCMGGRVSYLMAVNDPDLKAAAVFYGGNIMSPWGRGRPAPFEGTAQINCPILGLFGEDDQNPSPADVKKLDEELTRLNKLHEFHSYPGAGHAFMSEGRPNYRAEAAADAWEKTLAWFNKYLKS